MATDNWEISPKTALPAPKDARGQHLFWGLLVSLPVNFALWGIASTAVQHHRLSPSAPITVRRILLTPPKAVRKPPPEKIARQMARVKPEPSRRIPKPRPLVPPRRIRPVVKPLVRPKTAARPPLPARQTPRQPQAHNHSLTAKAPTPAASFVLPGGDSPPGQPMSGQSPGDGHVSTDSLPQHENPPPSIPHNDPIPPSHHDPVPHNEPPAVPTGPTRDAQAERQVLPEIPEELKQDDYQSFVRVTVQIDADGSVTSVTLRGSSGSGEIDRRVVAALKRWRWKPALQAGRPIASTQRFRFEFEVH